jgi:uncharacterized RDD family membrane protein YckC
VTQPDLDDLGIVEDLVTGEAVVLALRPASFLSRATALILDWLVVVVAFVVMIWALTFVFAISDDAVGAAVGLVGLLAVFVGIPVTVETLTRGRSSASSRWGCASSATTAGRSACARR